MPVIRGNVTPKVEFKIGAATAKDVTGALRSYAFADGEGEVTTFTERAAGLRPAAVTLTFDLEFGTGSAYDYFATEAGKTATFTLLVDGSKAVSADNPAFTGTATMPAVPFFEVEQSNEKASFEVEVQLDSFNYAKTGGGA